MLPHHVGHYLGMDLHDCPAVSRSIPLQSNMVITVEPGVYIPKNDNRFPLKYRGVGIRIEDDVVIAKNSPIVLSVDAPKELKDISA